MKVSKTESGICMDFTNEIIFHKDKTAALHYDDNMKNAPIPLEIQGYSVYGLNNRKLAVKALFDFVGVNKYVSKIIVLFIKR